MANVYGKQAAWLNHISEINSPVMNKKNSICHKTVQFLDRRNGSTRISTFDRYTEFFFFSFGELTRTCTLAQGNDKQ